MRNLHPRLTALLIVPLLAVAAPAAAQAQDSAAEDSRWMAWMGCWEAADAQGQDENALLVCFSPLADRGGVEVRTLVDGDVVAVEEIVADGAPVPAEDGGCTGDRWAEWSADGHRVFIGSDLACGEGVHRSTSGVMALTDEGREWLEIHAVRSGDREPVLGVRSFVPASTRTLEAQGVEPAVRDRDLAIQTARTAKSGPLDHDDVVELVDRTGADVTRALIAEMGQPFQLSASVARDLRDRGVPADVLDVMVAVSHPERFDIAGGSWEASEHAAQQQARAVAPWPATRRVVGYSPFAGDWYLHSRYYGMYGYSSWNPYFGPGFRGGGGYWPGRVIIVRPEVIDRRRGILDPESGYVRPGSSGSDRSATQRGARSGNQSGSAANRTPRNTNNPAASSRPSNTRPSPQGARSSGSSGSSSSDERRARPRNQGSGGGG